MTPSIRNSDMIEAFKVAANSLPSSPSIGQASGHRYVTINTRSGLVGTTTDKDQASNIKDLTINFERLIKDNSVSLGEKRELINDFSKITSFFESTSSSIFDRIYGGKDKDKNIKEAQFALRTGNETIKKASLEIKNEYLQTIRDIANKADELRGEEPVILTDAELQAISFADCSGLYDIIFSLTRPSGEEVSNTDLSKQLNKLTNELMEAKLIFNSKITTIFGLAKVDKDYLAKIDESIK